MGRLISTFTFIQLVLLIRLIPTPCAEDQMNFHRRTKRFLWFSSLDRKLVLPPGSTLVVTPRLQIPFLRQPPEGLNSDIQVSWPFYMFFDKLGWTGDAHPWPPKIPTSLRDLFNPVRESIFTRKRRAVLSLPPPENIHGGERAIILPKLERILNGMGYDGRACLLRTICEIHEFPMDQGYGLFGEFITLLFTISNSPFSASHLSNYLLAEKYGKLQDCTTYYKNCTSSIFKWEKRSHGKNVIKNSETIVKQCEINNAKAPYTESDNDIESSNTIITPYYHKKTFIM